MSDSVIPWTVACQTVLSMGFSRVGCHHLLQGIFPTQGANPGLPHCRQTLYHLSHQGSLISGRKESEDTWATWSVTLCTGYLRLTGLARAQAIHACGNFRQEHTEKKVGSRVESGSSISQRALSHTSVIWVMDPKQQCTKRRRRAETCQIKHAQKHDSLTISPCYCTNGKWRNLRPLRQVERWVENPGWVQGGGWFLVLSFMILRTWWAERLSAARTAPGL